MGGNKWIKIIIKGNLNAYTSRENTSYTMQVLKGKEREGMEVLADMLRKS